MRWAATASTFPVGLVTVWLLRNQVSYRWALASAVLLQTLPFAAFLLMVVSRLSAGSRPGPD